MDRRDFLALAGASAGSVMLTGCGGGSAAPDAGPVTAQPPGANPDPPAGPPSTNPPPGSPPQSEPPPTPPQQPGSQPDPPLQPDPLQPQQPDAQQPDPPQQPGEPEPHPGPDPQPDPNPEPDPNPGPEPDPNPEPEPPEEPPPLSAEMRALQDHLRAHASPVFALPAASSAPPRIFWAGRVTDGAAPPTTLPAGTRYPASSPLIAGAIREHHTAMAGAPLVGGLPCLAVSRPYTCKGQPRNANARPSLRIRTDAPVIELTGILPDGAGSVQSLIVDGRLVPSTALSASRGRGGWTAGTIVIDFGTRATRDIRIDTGLILAYIKIDQLDTLFPVDDRSEPQISVIGDSYQQARSVTFATDGAIAQEIGARLGIGKVVTDAIGGTGYYNSGGDRGNLNDRLPAHVSDNSIVYVIMAGLNDYGDYTGTPVRLDLPSRAVYERSVSDYIRNLRLARPQALIVVTAPFCPIPPQSDSTYVTSTLTNNSGLGDFTYIARLHKEALQAIEGPWVYIDVLMGGGWRNSSGATGDVTGLQWFTGGTPGPGTSPTYKPGNTRGGGGGGFGGIARVPIFSGGAYAQGPEIVASGGSGRGFLATSIIDASGRLTEVRIIQPGHGYTEGAGLPQLHIDPTYETTPAMLGTPELVQGINPDGAYPLPSFAPPGATDLNNIYRLLSQDQTHPSPLGVEYLSKRLAQNIYQAVMAL